MRKTDCQKRELREHFKARVDETVKIKTRYPWIGRTKCNRSQKISEHPSSDRRSPQLRTARFSETKKYGGNIGVFDVHCQTHF